MARQPRTLSGDYANDHAALQEVLDDLSRGVDDGYVRESAGIRLSKLRYADLGLLTIGTTKTPVRHGLPGVPLLIHWLPQSDVRVWESGARDRDNVYLTASSSAKVRLVVGM